MNNDELAEVKKERDMYRDVIKEVTYQMHNEGNGEYTIPAWFARSLYDHLKGAMK